MSRAFVDDDAGSDETADLHEIPIPLPPGAKNYMTPEGALRLSDELRELVEVGRPRAARALASAEPANKAEFLRQISEIDRRISYLSRMKSILSVVEAPGSVERVVFGLRVLVRECADSPETAPTREVQYRIVGVDESDPDRGCISWASPIAKALIGKRVGDRVHASLPLGGMDLTILRISRAESP